nr:DUF2779 domain-containing protein [Mycoplasmopsis canis]WQQ12125.1 DUF2779 domain-containing protein [Mycoplasmopsis canis]
MKESKNVVPITWSIFKRVFGLNPSIIFNGEKIVEYLEKHLNNKNDYEEDIDEDLEDSSSIINYALIDELGIESISKQLHELNLINSKEEIETYIEIFASNFFQYKNKAEDFIINELKIEQQNLKVVSATLKQELKIEQTNKHLEDAIINKKNIFILNPVFSYNEKDEQTEFKFIASPFGVHVNNGKIDLYLLSYTSKSKGETYFQSFYLYWLLKNIGVEINRIKNIIIDPRTKIFNSVKKGQLNFVITESANMSSTVSKSKSKGYIDYINDIEFVMKKTGWNLLVNNEKFINKDSYNWPISLRETSCENSFVHCAINKKILLNELSINKILYNENQIDDLNIFYDKVKDDLNNTKYSGSDRWKNLYLSFESGNLWNKQVSVPSLKEETKSSLKEHYIFQDFKWYTSVIRKAYKEFSKELNIDALLFFGYWFNSDGELTNSIHQINYWLENEKINYKINIDRFEISKDFIKENKQLTFLLRELILKRENLEFINYSGNFKKVKNVREIVALKESMDEFKMIPNTFDINALNVIKKLHIKDKRISWYDYEGLSDIFPPIDGVDSYNQTVYQVSVIITQNGVEKSVENIVKDPKHFTYNDYVEIIDSIYANGADYFVVFNKGYENTRNSEMLRMIKNKIFTENDEAFIEWLKNRYSAKDKQEAFLIVEHRIKWINENTIDLAEVFTPKSTEKMQNRSIDNIYEFELKDSKFIFKKANEDFLKIKKVAYFQISYLKFFYSIKKIEKYITENNIHLSHMITPYSSLKIQKGTMAMSEAVNRFLEATNDAVWETNVVPELKKYCENDVRAMIMVYDLIMYAARQIFSNLSEFEYKLIDTNNYVANNEYKVVNNELKFGE